MDVSGKDKRSSQNFRWTVIFIVAVFCLLVMVTYMPHDHSGHGIFPHASQQQSSDLSSARTYRFENTYDYANYSASNFQLQVDPFYSPWRPQPNDPAPRVSPYCRNYPKECKDNVNQRPILEEYARRPKPKVVCREHFIGDKR